MKTSPCPQIDNVDTIKYYNVSFETELEEITEEGGNDSQGETGESISAESFDDSNIAKIVDNLKKLYGEFPNAGLFGDSILYFLIIIAISGITALIIINKK